VSEQKTPPPRDYDASAIRVLTDEEIAKTFDWAKIGALASQYGFPTEHIERALEACRRADVDFEDYYVERYLKGNLDVPLNKDVSDAMNEILIEHRDRSEKMSKK
jgi:hypothetical protein